MATFLFYHSAGTMHSSTLSMWVNSIYYMGALHNLCSTEALSVTLDR